MSYARLRAMKGATEKVFGSQDVIGQLKTLLTTLMREGDFQGISAVLKPGMNRDVTHATATKALANLKKGMTKEKLSEMRTFLRRSEIELDNIDMQRMKRPPLAEPISDWSKGVAPTSLGQQAQEIKKSGYPVGKGLKQLRKLLVRLANGGEEARKMGESIIRSDNVTQLYQRARRSTGIAATDLKRKMGMGKLDLRPGGSGDTRGSEVISRYVKGMEGDPQLVSRGMRRVEDAGLRARQTSSFQEPPKRGYLGGDPLSPESFGAMGAGAGLAALLGMEEPQISG